VEIEKAGQKALAVKADVSKFSEVEKLVETTVKKFNRIDRNGDGRLTREELQAWLAARRAARTGKSG